MKKNYQLKLIIITVLACFITHSSLANIIIDSEIEEVIKEISAPLAKKANIRDLKIYLLNDDSLNAFTAGGNIIYINSGIIKKFQNLDVMRGVIAHEIGHIKAGHVSRQIANIEDYRKLAILGTALGIGAMLASENVGTAVLVASPHIAERAVLKYSREYEFTADKTALMLLEQNGMSSQGMIEFFEYMKKGENRSLFNPYDQTHPLTQDRINNLRSFYQKSIYKKSIDSNKLEYKYSRIRAKLIGFTSDPKKILTYNNFKFNEEVNNYLKAVTYFKYSDLNNALSYINKLTNLHPNDAFYQELKGQILFEFGKKEAIDYYNKAVCLRPSDLTIRLGRAIVAINIYSDPTKLKEAHDDLKLIVTKEENNIIALYYLSVYYDKIAKKAESLLYLALIAFKNDDLPKAQKLAKASVRGLSPYSPEWYKANDIISAKPDK